MVNLLLTLLLDELSVSVISCALGHYIHPLVVKIAQVNGRTGYGVTEPILVNYTNSGVILTCGAKTLPGF